jgi:hypothetical protein
LDQLDQLDRIAKSFGFFDFGEAGPGWTTVDRRALMDLRELLARLRADGLSIHVEGQRALLRGGSGSPPADVLAALAEHRPHLLRLHRPPRTDCRPEWREALDRSVDSLRAAWAERAAELEAEGKMHPRAAEYLAADELRLTQRRHGAEVR